MKLTIAELAKILNGEFIGEGTTSLSNLAKIEEATDGDITFISNTRYLPWLYKTGASVIIIDKGLEYDKGKILFQKKIQIKDGETPDSLAQKIHKLEHIYFSQILEKYLLDKL